MIQVAILFGGYSAEHDVSIMSANSIGKAIDPTRFTVHFIGFDRTHQPHLIKAISSEKSERLFSEARLISMVELTTYLTEKIDVVFPIIHGPGGEDGKLQGYLSTLGLAYVGADVMGSSICMDKRLCREVLRANQVNVVPSLSVNRLDYQQRGTQVLEELVNALDLPLFTKPSNLGSSIGISKVKSIADLDAALRLAFRYDHQVVVEKGIDARELECAVYGNAQPVAMSVGEIIPSHEMYDYEAKYSEDCLSELVIPAKIDAKTVKAIQQMALKAYRLLGVTGMARVDFLVDKHSGVIYLNELNTLPGFTKYSMYPLLCQDGGLVYRDLISTLIDLALERKGDEHH